MLSLTRLIIVTAALAWLVVMLGAYVRLSDAGLGCPDWPGCYGQLGAPSSAQAVRAAEAAFPAQPVEAHKAWKEMAHRYAAGTLGLLILFIFLRAWREKAEIRWPAAALLALVLFQALLGRWTVTELLRPAIVSAHLLGGMATLALLAWLGLARRGARPHAEGVGGLRLWAGAALLVVAMQIALGGWTSSHNAALICGAGLSCRGEWVPAMDFAAAFLPDSTAVSLEALTAIHWSHRLGALAVACVVAPLALVLLRSRGLQSLGWLLLALLALQIGLGLANVAFGLPLATAVAHNAVAALLLAALVMVNHDLYDLRERSTP